MIVYDIACPQGHVFEAWFGSSAAFDDQRARGMLSCPICGAADVQKAVMAPNVGAKGNTKPDSAPVAMRGGTPAPAQVKSLLAALAKAQARMLEGSEDVGRRFADEARAIHDGAADERSIHGQATAEEARALLDDGVAVMPLLIVPPDSVH
jgi:hypothetical protein